jgi:hypothetical protein
MARPYFKKIKSNTLLQWTEGVREWDGYTISPEITLSVDYLSNVTMIVEIVRDDALTFENGKLTREVNLGEFNDEKTFRIEMEVKLLDESFIQDRLRILDRPASRPAQGARPVDDPPPPDERQPANLPQPQKEDIFVPGQPGKKYNVRKYDLDPNLVFNIIVKDSEEKSNDDYFYIEELWEVLNEADA